MVRHCIDKIDMLDIPVSPLGYLYPRMRNLGVICIYHQIIALQSNDFF